MNVRLWCHNVPTIVRLCLSRESLTVCQAKLWREGRWGGSWKWVSGHTSPELTSFSFSPFRSLIYIHTHTQSSSFLQMCHVETYYKRTDAFRRFPPLKPVKMSMWWQFDIWHGLFLNWMFVIVIVYSCAAGSFVPSFCKPFCLRKLYGQTTNGKDITFTISINAKLMISYGWC